MENRFFGRVIAFAGDNQNRLLSLCPGRVQKTGQRLQSLLARQAMEIYLVTDRNDTPFHLPEAVTAQRLQLTLIGNGIRKFCIQFQPADFLEKRTILNDAKRFFRFTGFFLQRMRAGLNRFFGRRLKWSHVWNRLQKKIQAVICRLRTFIDDRQSRQSRFSLRDSKPLQYPERSNVKLSRFGRILIALFFLCHAQSFATSVISMRRFLARPSLVPLSATGF